MLRQLARTTFNVVTALSLLLCVAVCVLWVRSQFVSDHIVHSGCVGGTSQTVWIFKLYTGNVWVLSDHYTFPPEGRDRFAVGAQRGQMESFTSWTPMTYRPTDSFFKPWANRAGWNLIRPRVRIERDPRRNFWGVAGVTLVRRNAEVPFWCLTLPLAVMPAAWFAGRRRRRRRRIRGLCRACGYDLRATPGRCPECGTAPSRPAPAKQTYSWEAP